MSLWSFHEYSGNLTTLTMKVEGETLHIHNCFEPPPSSHGSTEQGTLALLHIAQGDGSG